MSANRRHAIALASLVVHAAATATLLATTADASLVDVVRVAVVGGVGLHVAALLLGADPLVGGGVGALVVAATLGVLGESPDLGAPVVVLIGCGWFVAAELAWEAIARRDGFERARSATLRRLQEVGTVSALAVAVGLVAIVGSGAPPTRTLPLQALVVLLFAAAAIALTTRLRRVQDAQSRATDSM